jgi:hypothetical protein
MDSAPGIRTRNQFVRQLIEMGLLMMEDRMRRQDGLSARVSGGVADQVSASAMAMTRPSALTAATPALPKAPVDQKPIVPSRPLRLQSRLRRPRLLLLPSQLRRSRRSPLRWPGTWRLVTTIALPLGLGGVRAVRMLDGESF